MTRDEAKEILTTYRPGEPDGDEPELAAAFALLESDPELKTWFDQHRAFNVSMREGLRSIPVPENLAETIFRQHRSWWRSAALIATAAAIALLIVLTPSDHDPARETNTFEGFRSRMVRSALRQYQMDMVTNDLAEIRNFLARHQGHADYLLPSPLEKMPGDGCAVLRWNDHPVSLVCFRLNEAKDLYLFIINDSDLPNPPPGAGPEMARVNKLMTASWRSMGKTYLLAGEGDEAFLRKFL